MSNGMLRMSPLLFILFAVTVICIQACQIIDLKSQSLGSRRFESLGQQHVSSTGRATYKSSGDKPLYLFHATVGNTTGIGRWVVNDAWASDKALTYCDSWAVAPQHVTSVNDDNKLRWNVRQFSMQLKN
jgi:hypothetical protein